MCTYISDGSYKVSRIVSTKSGQDLHREFDKKKKDIFKTNFFLQIDNSTRLVPM